MVVHSIRSGANKSECSSKHTRPHTLAAAPCSSCATSALPSLSAAASCRAATFCVLLEACWSMLSPFASAAVVAVGGGGGGVQDVSKAVVLAHHVNRLE